MVKLPGNKVDLEAMAERQRRVDEPAAIAGVGAHQSEPAADVADIGIGEVAANHGEIEEGAAPHLAAIGAADTRVSVLVLPALK